MANAKHWEKLALMIDAKEQEIKILCNEWKDIQNKCNHPSLPKHELGETYRDICPDCGHISYCYSVGEI